MTSEEIKGLYRRVLEALNARDLDAAAALMAPTFVNHTPLPGEPPGVAGLHYRMGVLQTAFPDFRFSTEEALVDGDKISTRGTISGTNTGSFMGLPPTGKQVTVGYLDLVHFAGGKMTEHWAQMDQMGLMQQLGAAPAP